MGIARQLDKKQKTIFQDIVAKEEDFSTRK